MKIGPGMENLAQVVDKTFSFEGAAAQEVAAFLGIDRGGSLELELADFLSNGSAGPRNRISWDAHSKILTIEGKWYDWSTVAAARSGPRYSFDGPYELDQKSLGIFKHWAKVYQRVQAHGKRLGRRSTESRRAILFRMESDKERRASWPMRRLTRWFKRSQTIVFDSLAHRNGKGLWLEVRVGPWQKA
jgi:hypothetical protein